jgi:hypothetical protein
MAARRLALRCHRECRLRITVSRQGEMPKVPSLGRRRSYRIRGDGRFRRVSPVAVGPGEGPLTEPTADPRACRWELAKMPLKRPCRRDRGTARSGGLRAFAIGVVVAALAPIPDVRT